VSAMSEAPLFWRDATAVDLCLSMFPWTHFRSTKTVIKINTQLDLRGKIPTAIHVTPGPVHEVNLCPLWPRCAGSTHCLQTKGSLIARRQESFTALAYPGPPVPKHGKTECFHAEIAENFQKSSCVISVHNPLRPCGRISPLLPHCNSSARCKLRRDSFFYCNQRT